MSQTQFTHPRLSLPPQLTGSQGGFAYNTVNQRLPDIAKRVIVENDFPLFIVENLETLVEEILGGLVRQLREAETADTAEWVAYIEPYEDQRWLDIPWYFAEVYFYRRILEATHYFQPGQWQGLDPFEYQKRLGLTKSMDSIQALSTLVNSWSQPQLRGAAWNPDNFITLLYVALWGNRADLSLWPAGENQSSRLQVDREQAYILVDDSTQLTDRVISWQGRRFDIIVDNAGFELFCDLCLADFLLSSNTADVVCLHLKHHPLFVSDAMIKDVRYTVEVLSADDNADVQAFATRLQASITAGRLSLQDHPFWTAPKVFWEMPEPLRQDLAAASLIVVKGDANYRRLLGDCQWPFTTPFEEIVCYFPTPLVALRTLKSELAAGLQLSQAEALTQEDPQWLTNGRWGVIQFHSEL